MKSHRTETLVEQGYHLSLYNAAQAHILGIGIEQNTLLAKKYYEAFLKQPGNTPYHASAQHNLAIIYADGALGIPQDTEKAMRYYELASTGGFHLASYNLACMHFNKESIRQEDIEKTLFYLRRANAQGNPEALEKMEKIYSLGLTKRPQTPRVKPLTTAFVGVLYSSLKVSSTPSVNNMGKPINKKKTKP